MAVIRNNLFTNYGLALKEPKQNSINTPNITGEISSIFYAKNVLTASDKNYLTQNWSGIRHRPIQNVKPHTPYAAFAVKTVFRQNIIPGLLTRSRGLKRVCCFVCVGSLCPELTPC
jgi:hypothetical protein